MVSTLRYSSVGDVDDVLRQIRGFWRREIRRCHTGIYIYTCAQEPYSEPRKRLFGCPEQPFPCRETAFAEPWNGRFSYAGEPFPLFPYASMRRLPDIYACYIRIFPSLRFCFANFPCQYFLPSWPYKYSFLPCCPAFSSRIRVWHATAVCWRAEVNAGHKTAWCLAALRSPVSANGHSSAVSLLMWGYLIVCCSFCDIMFTESDIVLIIIVKTLHSACFL